MPVSLISSNLLNSEMTVINRTRHDGMVNQKNLITAIFNLLPDNRIRMSCIVRMVFRFFMKAAM